MHTARAPDVSETRRRRATPLVVVVSLVLLASSGLALASEVVEAATRPRASAIQDFVDAVATTLETRAGAERATGPVELDVVVGRGLDPALLERAFTSRLRQRLRTKGALVPTTKAPLKARVVVSIEGPRVWATGQIEGGTLPGPSSFAVSRALDRELEALVGKGKEPLRARWSIERLGPVPSGVLDVALADIDGDFVDDIVVVRVDEVRAFRFAPGDSRPNEIGKRVALAQRRWPRVVVAWVADRGEGRVWVATSRGDHTVVDLVAGTASELPLRGVPLRQTVASSNAEAPLLLASGSAGTPLLSFPLKDAAGADVVVDWSRPFAFRDLARVAERDGAWLWVDSEGFLGARAPGGSPVRLTPMEPIGDRVVVADLDADGELEIVASAATAPGDADVVSVLRLDRGLTTTDVVFRSALAGGEIAAIAVGDLDLDARPDVVIVEETGDSEAMVWRLEHAP